jgi:hypothetical protein
MQSTGQSASGSRDLRKQRPGEVLEHVVRALHEEMRTPSMASISSIALIEVPASN